MNLLFTPDDVNSDKPDTDGGTAHWWVSYDRHKGVVNYLLLARDGVNPDKPDEYGRIFLRWGSINGYEGVAGVLLARHDIKPLKRDNHAETPLWSAP